ncbi:MAG: uracil-DNA glycosylase [Bdellovibrionales bacterium]|jgi:DNA polymerase
MEQVLSTIEALVWQVEAGADEAICNDAGFEQWKGRTASVPSVAPVPAAAAPPLAPLAFVSQPSKPLAAAPALARPPAEPLAATTLEQLRDSLACFEGCGLKATAMNLVFAAGNPKAKIMIVGDVPAEDEDRQGLPFVGESGHLLDKMLASIGLDRESVYLTNLVFWRPPGNRSPSEVEVEACLPFTERHIALVQPKLLIVMGQLATKTLLRTKDTFSKKRGQWTSYSPCLGDPVREEIRCLPFYHPTYLLRQPAAKRQAWVDLLRLKQEINDTI